MRNRRRRRGKIYRLRRRARYKVNPFAVCNAQKTKYGWSKAKTERCIMDIKKRKRRR